MERAIDIETALSHTDGDRELLSHMAEIFLGECPELLSEMRRAAGSADWHILERTAHSLKSSLAIFGGASASQAALRLEKMAANRESNGLAEVLARLEEEVSRAMADISDLCRKEAA